MAGDRENPFLPFEIVIKILQRLPIKSVVRFRCVCKDWKNLLTTKSFVANQVLHSTGANPFLLIHEYNCKFRRSSLRLLDHDMETAEILCTGSVDSFKRGWKIVGSCHGLLCVELDTDEGRFPVSHLLWNPVINEVKEVPQNLNDYKSLSRVGFGYSAVVKDFKLVRIYHPELLKKKEEQQVDNARLDCAQMYSLSTSSWKELDFGAVNAEFLNDAVSVNGTFFWFGWGFYPTIVSFDIAKEVFTITTIQNIPSSVNVTEHCFCPYQPVVYGNKLAMCDGIHSVVRGSKTYSIHMWVVEEDVSESENSLICTEKSKIGPLSTVLKPLCIWRNQIVCIYVKGEAEGKGKDKGDLKDFFYLFNLATKEWTKFYKFSAPFDHCAVFNYERSPVSLCNN